MFHYMRLCWFCRWAQRYALRDCSILESFRKCSRIHNRGFT